MSGALRLRTEAAGDHSSIDALHRAAFARGDEADLVQRLRRDGDLVLSLVGDEDGVVGYVAFSRLTLEGPGPSVGVTALAPLAVRPDAQRRGIGSALVREGLNRLADRGESFVVVLGDPGYYGRLGFSNQCMRELETPYDGPFLQGLPLRAFSGEVDPVHRGKCSIEEVRSRFRADGNGSSPAFGSLHGKIRYPAAFDELS